MSELKDIKDCSVEELKNEVSELRVEIIKRGCEKENEANERNNNILQDDLHRLEKINAELLQALGASNLCLIDWIAKGGAKNTSVILSDNSKLIDKYETKQPLSALNKRGNVNE